MLNAAQQQGLEAIQQGMAPSANQQAALHSLWEKAPGHVPAHRGGWDEFPSAPAADAADGFRSGPSALGAAQDAGEAAQRQAFLKWTQGEAMTAQEKAFVEDLWNTDPARASEYWAAGEFLDTGAPTSSALDGGGLDGTMKAEAEAPPTDQRTPFNYLQDGKGWEAPPAGPDDVIRDGSHMSNGKLRPNVKYQAGEFEYIYQTDELARIFWGETEKLQITERGTRLKNKRNTPGKIKGIDHAGHIFGDMFGGSPELDNLVSQLAKVNQGQYKALEMKWAKAIRNSQHVSVDVKVLYSGDEMRPRGGLVHYFIDGKESKEYLGN